MKKRLSSVTKILTVIFAALLCIMIPGYRVAVEYRTVINKAFKIAGEGKEYRIENNNDSDVDTNYFPSDFGDDTAGLASYIDEVTREVEGEGLVLLKNDTVDGAPALPLKANAQVSTFFYASYKLNYSASGSGGVSSDEGFPDLKTALNANNFGVNQSLLDFYKDLPTDSGLNGFGREKRLRTSTAQFQTYYIREAPWSRYSSVTGSFEAHGDAAIFVIARDSGEGSEDLSVVNSDGENGNYLAISPQEREVLEEVTKLKAAGTFKKIIVLLNSSAPMELDFMYDDGIDVDACMWIGNLGTAGIHAVSDALAGKIVPSGRASDIWCRDNLSSPAMKSWSINPDGAFSQSYGGYSENGLNATQRYYGVYNEGIYVGYRYYETRYEDYILGQGNAGEYDYKKDVAYSFGHGLSYSEFEYSDFAVRDNSDDTYTVSVKVTNTGDYAGKEVVQIYLQKPYDTADKVEKASVELVGFAKTDVLSANGGSESVTITVDKETFKSYDSEVKKTYILSKGAYYLAVGENAHDALNNILAAKGRTPENTSGRMDAAGNSDFALIAWDNAALDADKYSKSTETETLITNQLDFADINRYENRGTNATTYVSRSNWTGTMPVERTLLTVANEAMKNDLMSHKEILEDGSAAVTYGADKGITLAMLRGRDYDDSAWDDFLNQMTYAEQAQFLTSAGYGSMIIKRLGYPGTVDADGPTSVISHSKTGRCYPSQGIWASSFNLALIEKIGAMMGEDARIASVKSMYAPGLNIHRVPYGGRSHEYYSEDPFLSGIAVISQVKGLQSKGVIPTLKHFAFNDQEWKRNGIGTWLNEQSAREIYLLPFEYGMRPSMGGALGMMTSFNRAGCIWTGASTELMLNIVQDEWGYVGYNITDMVTGNGALYMVHDDGFMNGTELFLATGTGSDLSEFKNSPAFQNKMRNAVKRVFYVICNYSAAMNGIGADSKIVPIMPWWQATLMTFLIIFAVFTAAGAGFWVYFEVKTLRGITGKKL